MKLEEVIELGKQSNVVREIHWLSGSFWSSIVLTISILYLIYSICRAIIKTFQTRRSFRSKTFIFHFNPISVALVSISLIFYLLSVKIEIRDEVDKWKNEVVKPYIESLPIEKKEIVFIKIDPELDYRIDERYILGTGRTTISAVEKTPVVVSYKDKGIVTKAFWYETDMDLTKKDKPYIEFQKLEHDLGHGIEPGIYNVKIHLPESYEFTEIK